MPYHYSRKVTAPFEDVVSRLTENLKHEGFTVTNCIDVRETLRKNLNINFREYKILAAFNPEVAYKAISLESHAGLLFPCHIVVQQHENGEVEVSAISGLETLDKDHANGLVHEMAAQIDAYLRVAVDNLHRVVHAPGHPEALPTADAADVAPTIPG